ncbi:hypothetical protein VTN02DRAFT_352 [Thermoascus thermophilus]
MRPPSPQLLRVLRTSTSTTTTGSLSRRLLPLPRPLPRPYSQQQHIHRPERIIPRQPRPATHDRSPHSPEKTAEEKSRTSLAALDVLGDLPAPASAVDACLDDGFLLSDGTRVAGGDGVLVVGGEAFAWRPWEDGRQEEARRRMVNVKGQFEVDERVWGLLGVVWPRPDLLILGLGASVLPLSPETKRHIHALGIRVEVLDTRNAAAQFTLLATERGVVEVAAALIPVGWSGV